MQVRTPNVRKGVSSLSAWERGRVCMCVCLYMHKKGTECKKCLVTFKSLRFCSLAKGFKNTFILPHFMINTCREIVLPGLTAVNRMYIKKTIVWFISPIVADHREVLKSQKNQPTLKQNESRTQNPTRDCPHKRKRIQVKN